MCNNWKIEIERGRGINDLDKLEDRKREIREKEEREIKM